MNQTSTFGSNLNQKFQANGDTVNDNLPDHKELNNIYLGQREENKHN